MQTLPYDVAQAQRAILAYLHALPAGHRLFIEDLARAPQLRRVHFASIERAVGALVKRGLVCEEREPGLGARVWLRTPTQGENFFRISRLFYLHSPLT